jgi:hypothetical protein
VPERGNESRSQGDLDSSEHGGHDHDSKTEGGEAQPNAESGSGSGCGSVGGGGGGGGGGSGGGASITCSLAKHSNRGLSSTPSNALGDTTNAAKWNKGYVKPKIVFAVSRLPEEMPTMGEDPILETSPRASIAQANLLKCEACSDT